jgi:multicomponent Na+:H+ antiporter subunit E
MPQDAPVRDIEGAVARGALFLALWLAIAGWKPADLPVGLAAAAGALWASLQLVPASKARPRYGALAGLIFRILRGSVAAGFDIARRALNPRLALNPGLVSCPISLPEGTARNVFFAIESLQPGTLPTGAQGDSLIVHALEVSLPVAAELAKDEAQFARALGHE